MYHVVRHAKLFDKTLEKNLFNLLSVQFAHP